MIKYPEDKVDEKYIVPEGTVVIGKEAFNGTKYLKELSLPLSLNIIEDYAFTLCYNLSIVTWKHFPQSIGELLLWQLIYQYFIHQKIVIIVFLWMGYFFRKTEKLFYAFQMQKM